MNFVKNMVYGNKIKNFLSTGNEHLQDENYYSAINIFSEVLQLDKKNEDALLSRAKCYIKIKKNDKAKIDLEFLETISPDYDPKINLLLSKIYLSDNKTKESSEYAEKYFSTNTNDLQVQYFTARSKYFNGEYEEALKLVDYICKRHPNDFSIRYLKSLILFSQNNLTDAIENINKAIEIDSLNGFAFNLRGLINIQLLNSKEAIEDFDYAIRLNPANTVYYFNKAKIQLKIGDLIDAQTSIDYAIELDRNNKAAYILKAELNIMTENHTEALKDYQNAFNIEKQDFKILKQIANLKIYLYDFQGAIEDLKRIVEVEKDNAELFYKIAFLDFKIGNEEKALSNLMIAIKLNPEYKQAVMQKGIMDFWTEQYEDSIKMFDSLYKIDSSNEKAVLYKARALMNLGNVKEAASELLKISNESKDKNYHLLSSLVNLNDKNIILAQSDLDNAERTDNSDETVLLANNVIKVRLGMFDSISEINDNNFDDENKVNSKIVKTLVSFEKGHYNTVKYHLNNLSNLDDERKNKLKPLANYSKKQIDL